MIITVLGAVAELERSLIAERVRAGLRNARADGRRLQQAWTLCGLRDCGRKVPLSAKLPKHLECLETLSIKP